MVNIDKDIDDTKWFLSFITPGAASSDEVAEAAYDAAGSIRRLVGFVQAVRPVPTKHDQNLEMDYWDNLIHEMKERAENG